jgi:hypothetical protein
MLKNFIMEEIYHCAARHPIHNVLPDRENLGLQKTRSVFFAFNNSKKIDRFTFNTLTRYYGLCMILCYG